ncbi:MULTISPECIES: recombination protein NinG [unclassified Pseudomonas]|uniref:recombination protein NinG n=1 Tax=unclassified Pseudomonas TaxID=196821 RepID=UPI002B224F4D|nr:MULTISPECIES: recombination protein NinG [unclassified Pseudomonas]MEA9994557.1 recombination protein NinG [Pseudomonas sp. AA4]MEB0085702.1 recombination protein NinG [Pseudomonas sp. RTI1]MEB0125973.1 recombination protein NinG [Pseudomonas sp. CCC1.2]MEB0152777.1 recombination protein NinG [Pseudomonas sp. CCC4.3]MEB0221282.1 recombination protein NinG [Pseudomonas sp. AB12(2023)]
MSLQRKKKQCANSACDVEFIPSQLGQKVCGWACGLAIAPANQDRARKALADVERKEIKVRKEKLKSRGDYVRECQQAFNEFIRWRDQLAGHACVSSGKPLDWSGNAVDAGHYRSVGSAPHLRFDERNCHAQSKQDNRFLSGNAVDYRIGLIARIGLDSVEALEADQSVRKYTVEQLQQLKADFRAKIRELKRIQA